MIPRTAAAMEGCPPDKLCVAEGRAGEAPLSRLLEPTGRVHPRCQVLNFLRYWTSVLFWFDYDRAPILPSWSIKLCNLLFFIVWDPTDFGLLERLCNFREALNFGRDIECFKETELCIGLGGQGRNWTFKVFEFLKIVGLLKVGMFYIIVSLMWDLRDE